MIRLQCAIGYHETQTFDRYPYKTQVITGHNHRLLERWQDLTYLSSPIQALLYSLALRAVSAVPLHSHSTSLIF